MSTNNSSIDETSVYKSALEDLTFSNDSENSLNLTDNSYFNKSYSDIEDHNRLVKRKRNDSSESDEIILISDEDDDTTLGKDSLKLKHVTIDVSDEFQDTSADVSNFDDSDVTQTLSKIKIYKNIEEFEKNLPQTVTLLTTPCGSKVYLVGTAHFSEQSQDDVSLVIRNVQPDIVMVELCPARIHILKHNEKTLLEEARDINITKIRNIIQTNGLFNGVFYILLLNMSAKLTKELGMAPGGEFRRALEEARRLQNCLFHLGDRPINITLQRAFYGLSLWQTLKLMFRIATSNETISKEEVEQCKQRDLLEELMKEMAGEYPALGDVFVKERDLYLSNSLQIAALPDTTTNHQQKPVKVVGVVGIGHVDGIVKHWGKVDSSKIPAILIIPQASLSNRIAKFTIKYGTLGLISYGLFKFIKPRLPKFL